jgi:hypothetical protein
MRKNLLNQEGRREGAATMRTERNEESSCSSSAHGILADRVNNVCALSPLSFCPLFVVGLVSKLLCAATKTRRNDGRLRHTFMIIMTMHRHEQYFSRSGLPTFDFARHVQSTTSLAETLLRQSIVHGAGDFCSISGTCLVLSCLSCCIKKVFKNPSDALLCVQTI